MTSARARGGAASLLALALLFTQPRAAGAWACPSSSRTLATAFPRASLVFTARALSTTRTAGRDEPQTRVRVERVFRGTAVQVGAELVVFTCRGDKCRGGMARGGVYLIDAFADARGRVHEVGACGFTTEVTSPRGAAVLAEIERLAAGAP